MDVRRRWPEAHFVVAGLITEFAVHGCSSGYGLLRSLKFSLNSEVSSENGENLRSHFDVFGLGIANGFSLQRAIRPSELQRNEKLVPGLIAVDMEAGQHDDLERLGNATAALDGDLLDRADGQLTLLRRT